MPVPYTVLINPELTPIGEEQDEDWEGCLSVPGMRGLVPRYRELRYTGFDAAGTPIDRTVKDFHARVVQHEVDHLDGILYPRRIRDLTPVRLQRCAVSRRRPGRRVAGALGITAPKNHAASKMITPRPCLPALRSANARGASSMLYVRVINSSSFRRPLRYKPISRGKSSCGRAPP